MSNKIFALVGMCGAGKSVVVDYLMLKGWVRVYFGGITMDVLEQRGIPVTPENEKSVREELRRLHGMAAFATLSMPKIEDGLRYSNVIIDGLYSWSEYKVLKEKYGDDLVIVAVCAPPKVRYERLQHRHVRPFSPEDAKKRDYAEIENIEKAGPIAMADYTLMNTGSIDQLIAQIRDLVE